MFMGALGARGRREGGEGQPLKEGACPNPYSPQHEMCLEKAAIRKRFIDIHSLEPL